MSRKSSLNLARVLSSLDWLKLGTCIHVTLTYWKVWPSTKVDLALVKQNLSAWFARNADGGIWRLEYQHRAGRESRGTGAHAVPHWHLLLWLGTRDVPEWIDRVRSWWSGYGDNRHERACHFTLGDQARGTWYLAMHAAKREQAPLFRVGRWWGYVNRASLLGAQDFQSLGEVGEASRVWWSRLYRRATGCRVRNAGGFSWFLPRSEQCKVRVWVAQRIEFEATARNLRPARSVRAGSSWRAVAGGALVEITKPDDHSPALLRATDRARAYVPHAALNGLQALAR